jgi:DNA repair protein RadA/Sms
MTKSKVMFCCQSCGAYHPKWSGQCIDCGNWNTIIEEIGMGASMPSSKYHGYAGGTSAMLCMADVTLNEELRLSSGLQELDRVLGGGIIMGSAILIGGDPGIGKSTILLQAVSEVALQSKVLYVTGEESPQQITLRARRLGLSEDRVFLLADTQIENILNCVRQEKPKVLVIDSIQTMQTSLLSAAPGSVSQVRESAMQLVAYAKQTGTALFLVGHVTKEGNIAGPRVLEHMVDTVLYFEGGEDNRYRMVRAVKNRYGAVNELGIFAMTDKGLREVNQPSAIFLSRYDKPVAGSMITVTKEGSRPLLIEVQALVDQSNAINPRRLSVGLETQRLSMLLAILHRHCGISMHSMDIFLNVVGGLQIFETAADLPVLFAMLSSFRNQPLPLELIAFGELGLAGEIRPVPSGQERLKEAAKHGFKIAMVPYANVSKAIEGMEVIGIQTVRDAIDCFKQFSTNR